MALKQIKNKITSTQKTGKVTKAMEAVSAVKMRKTQEQALSSRSYVRTALRMLERIVCSTEAARHPLLEHRTAGGTLLVIVTSDKGLAGSVNSAVLKHAERFFAENETVDVIAIGRKAVDFARRMNATICAEYTNLSDSITVHDVRPITDAVFAAFNGNTPYRQAFVLYQNFQSTFEQRPIVRQLLPLQQREVVSTLNSIRPTTGKFSDEEIVTEASPIVHTVEPSAAEVLDSLVPQLVEILLFHALVESKACEHSARMVAMKSATDKTRDLVRSLTLEYNKERQSVITAEVSEITGGIEAMKT